MPFLTTPQEEWRAGSAVERFSSGTGRYVHHVCKGAACSTLVVRLKPLREVQHRHHSAAHQPNCGALHSRRGALAQRAKRTRVFAAGPRGWEGEPKATRTYAPGGFGADKTRTARA